MNSSILYVNVIKPFDSGFGGVSISGVSSTEDIIIPKTSTAEFSLNITTTTYGCYMIFVGDLNNTNGAFTTAMLTSNGSGGSINVTASSKGNDHQRISLDWPASSKVAIYQRPAGVGAGNYTYHVRVFSLF
jgi:hypothetical protein